MTLHSNETMVVALAMLYMSMAVTAVFIFDATSADEERNATDASAVAEGLQMIRRMKKKHARWQAIANDPTLQKKKRKFDYNRANTCIMQDYLGPEATLSSSAISSGSFESLQKYRRTFDPNLWHIALVFHTLHQQDYRRIWYISSGQNSHGA
jgi:hypothetical protein